jgi:PAS domain S-box-containing protein
MGQALYYHNDDSGFLKLIPYKKKSGEIFYGETSVFRLKDSSGNINSFVGLIRDVTEKLNRDMENKMWKHSIDALSEGLILLDEQFNILQYNKAVLDILEISDKNIKGRKSYELIHGTRTPPEHCLTCEAMENRKNLAEEYWEPYLNKYIKVSVDPVYDKNGEFEFTVYNIEESTSYKQHSSES